VAETRRHYLDVSWGQAHVLVRRTDGPLILALHKVTSASSIYRPLLPPLAALGYTVAALDLPGYGMSDPPPVAEPTLSWFAASVVDVVRALGFGSAWLLGNKTGASVAMRAAVDHPDAVDGLLLWSVPYLYPELRSELATEAVPTYGPDGAALAEHWRSVYAACSPHMAESVATRELGERLLAARHHPVAHRALARDDHGALLAAITQPTAIFANRDDGLVAETRRAAVAMPSATFTEFDFPSGYLTDEYPQQFAAFLDAAIRAG
jgi:pimeloyl-ACP methyl ester carboxylesterase